MKANKTYKFSGDRRWDNEMRNEVLSTIIDRYSDHTEVASIEVKKIMSDFGFGYDPRRLKEARTTRNINSTEKYTYSVEKLAAMVNGSAPVKVGCCGS